MIPVAHIRTGPDVFALQTLPEHAGATARLAGIFASAFASGPWGYAAGLLHDVGKYAPAFQAHIRASVLGGACGGGPDHATAGAWYAETVFRRPLSIPLAYCIAGHHAGLADWHRSLSARLACHTPPETGGLSPEACRLSPPVFPEFLSTHPNGRLKVHLWVRMLFSALTDADRLDTERFMNPVDARWRNRRISVVSLESALENYLARHTPPAVSSRIAQIRTEVLEACRGKTDEQPGFFSLTVPPAGGKTLAGLTWAVGHALRHGKRRIIAAVPCTGCIIQTARTFRRIFGPSGVVVHHCDFSPDETSLQQRLACENWDAPVIVTTHTRLFESLYGASAGECRKLHNLCNSVLILDEPQILPAGLLHPVSEALRFLIEDYGVSILMTSAVPPMLSRTTGIPPGVFSGQGPAKELVPDPSNLFRRMHRCEISIDRHRRPYADIAAELRGYRQVLCIVNTRRECREIWERMPAGTLHLSRQMCPAHILRVLLDIRTAVRSGQVMRVIATPLAETGTDLDFPVVFRALSGLDNLLRAAGHCNRRDLLPGTGAFRIFTSEAGTPSGKTGCGAQIVKEMLPEIPPGELFAPETLRAYFHKFLARTASFDTYDLCADLQESFRFGFAEAARKFRMTNGDEGRQVVVRYGNSGALLDKLQENGITPILARKLQVYGVSVRQNDFRDMQRTGKIVRTGGVWVQEAPDLYDETCGIRLNGRWTEERRVL